MQRRAAFVRFGKFIRAVACPSRQTLDLASIECELALHLPCLIEVLLPRASRYAGALNNTFAASARAVRPLAVGEPSRRAKVLCRIGVGRPSFGGQRTSGPVPPVRIGQTMVCVRKPCLR